TGPHIHQRVIPFPRLWTHVRFAAALWAQRPDVTFVPAHALPLIFPGAAVVTVHDLGYHFFPETHPGWPRRYLEWSTPQSARRAAAVLADSEATRRDLASVYGVPAEKVHVVYPGVDDSLRRVTDAVVVARVRTRYDLPPRYLFFIGTLQPRKNVARLVQAYARSGVYEQGVSLVLAGAQGWLYDPAWTAGVPGVITPGFVADEDTAALFSGALALVFPSLYEGFGFPVVEAMRCGTPVITSDTSSLPELTGDAALTVDPLDVDALASAMRQVIGDGALRARLVEMGYAQAARFTWQAAAQAALAALERAGGVAPTA
ncbi:MAG: glycosyltransferase family 4 protein, partial [Anaerolineae bacterium]|nr:glycosyltransferase family 4 protein [Anaerolineae bacterium]